MNFSLIICTYMRDEPLLKLLESVKNQTSYPDEILIIDGSTDDKTHEALEGNHFNNLKYFKVEPNERGLTKQRNFGIKLVSEASEVICFLDDDIILTPNYFKKLIETYSIKTDALAVGGYIRNEVMWQKSDRKKCSSKFYFDGWMREEPSRFRIRHYLGLLPDVPPGYLPTFAHGRSISYLPPSNKIYPVEFFMGGVSSYRKSLFRKIKFSNYFDGYGLYEDLDFCIKASNFGPLYVNTAAKLDHYHNDSGRPNKYVYGKMVIRNSWYIWKGKHPAPTYKAVIKFHLTSLLLATMHFTNSFYGSNKTKSFTESLGRFSGLLSLFYNKPKIQ